jgi:hypothetical protein
MKLKGGIAMLFTSTMKWLGSCFTGICIIIAVGYISYDLGFTFGKEHGKDIVMEEAYQKGLADYSEAKGEYYWVVYEM